MSKIPNNLIVFFHDKSAMPDVFKECIDASLAANPEFTLIFLDDDDVRKLIVAHFPQFQNIYGRIRVPAARSDIARLVALYQFGGVYTDISMAFRTPFRALYRREDELFVVRRDDAPAFRTRPHVAHIVNGIIASVPESDFILECLKRVYFNLSEGYVNYTVNLATGPSILTEAFYANRNRLSHRCSIGDFSILQVENFRYRRVSGVNNTWVEAQREGILNPDDLPQTPSPQDRAWRAFSDTRKPRLRHLIRRLFCTDTQEQ